LEEGRFVIFILRSAEKQTQGLKQPGQQSRSRAVHADDNDR
jgi:hypothetical protein